MFLLIQKVSDIDNVNENISLLSVFRNTWEEKMQRKHITSAITLLVALFFVFLLSGCSFGGESDVTPGQTVTSGAFCYTLNPGGKNWTIEKNYSHIPIPEECVIPSSFQGKPVTRVGTFGGTDIKSIEMPDTITKIDDLAFINCKNLREAALSDSITSIPNSLFKNTPLEKVNMPEKLIYIGDEAFMNTNITEIEFPENLAMIGYHAFQGTDLKHVVFTDTILSVDVGILSGCESLESVTVPFYRTPVGNWDERWSKGIPSSCSYIYNNGKTGLAYMRASKGSAGINGYICCGLPEGAADTEIIIPETHNGLPVIGIAANAFRDMTSLVSVSIPDSVISIGDNAFSGCASLALDELPAELQEIGASAFSGCSSLAVSAFPEKLKSIGFSAFWNTALTSAILPEGLESIGNNAFVHCESIKEAYIPESVTDVGNNIFGNCSALEKITVNFAKNNPSGWDREWKEGIPASTQIVPADVNKVYYSPADNGSSYAVSGLAAETTLESVVIPARYNNRPVTEIYPDAFSDCVSLKSVTIPDTIETIGSNAFAGCTTLETVALPESLREIGMEAFLNCTSLKVLTIPENVERIDSFAFMGCSSITSVEIPMSVKYLGSEIFASCSSLSSLTIPWAEGSLPSGWNIGWSGDCQVTYGDINLKELSDIRDNLDLAVSSIITRVIVEDIEGVSTSPSNIQGVSKYTVYFNGAKVGAEIAGAETVLYGSAYIDTDVYSGDQTQEIELEDGTTYDGEAHTASWVSELSGSYLEVRDIIVDGISLD